MATSESNQLEFRGKDIKECEQFISAVDKHARDLGKLQDDQWIAGVVAASMAGDALIWWNSLDKKVQGSWDSIREAMFTRYRLRFEGESGAEAEAFVDWVRQRALDAGKLDDPNWAAKLASGCFVGGALRWYTSLDPAIQTDWNSLQHAIFLQYSSSPAPPAPLSKSRARGRIRVQRPNEPQVYYLSKFLQTSSSEPGGVKVTPSLPDALQVEYELGLSFDDPRTLFIPDNQLPGRDALGMKWFLAGNAASYLELCGVDLSSGAGSPSPAYAGPLLTKPWKIYQPANSPAMMSLWALSESGGRLVALSYPSAPGEIWFRYTQPSGETAVELFFEPI